MTPFAKVATAEALQQLQALQEQCESSTGSSSSINNIDSIARICWDDIQIDNVLGKGAYSFVFEINNSQGALKCLKRSAIQDDPEQFITSATDLYMEGQILSQCSHPNIIRLQALSQESLVGSYSPNSTCANGYYIIVELLPGGTLQQQLQKWKQHDHGMMKSSSSLSISSKMLKFPKRANIDDSNITQIKSRLSAIAVPIVNALQYLHNQFIVVRDLKPDNIGFDAQGTLKLFDFGFARRIKDCPLNDLAGSYPYMAPEVGLGTYKKKMLLASDVYSFGVVLYELVTLQGDAFEKKCSSPEEFETKVFKNHWRPTLSKRQIPSKELRNLIQSCWDPNPSNRPTMKQVAIMLDAIISSDVVTSTTTSSSVADFFVIRIPDKRKNKSNKKSSQVCNSTATASTIDDDDDEEEEEDAGSCYTNQQNLLPRIVSAN